MLIEYLKLCMITQIKCFFATAHMGRAQKQLHQPTRCSLHIYLQKLMASAFLNMEIKSSPKAFTLIITSFIYLYMGLGTFYV